MNELRKWFLVSVGGIALTGGTWIVSTVVHGKEIAAVQARDIAAHYETIASQAEELRKQDERVRALEVVAAKLDVMAARTTAVLEQLTAERKGK